MCWCLLFSLFVWCVCICVCCCAVYLIQSNVNWFFRCTLFCRLFHAPTRTTSSGRFVLHRTVHALWNLYKNQHKNRAYKEEETVHFLEISLKWQLVCNFDIIENHLFSLFLIILILCFVLCLPYFHVSNRASFLPSTNAPSFSTDVVLTFSISVMDWIQTRQIESVQ